MQEVLCRLEYDAGRYVFVVSEEWVEAAGLGPGSMVTVRLDEFSVTT